MGLLKLLQALRRASTGLRREARTGGQRRGEHRPRRRDDDGAEHEQRGHRAARGAPRPTCPAWAARCASPAPRSSARRPDDGAAGPADEAQHRRLEDEHLQHLHAAHADGEQRADLAHPLEDAHQHRVADDGERDDEQHRRDGAHHEVLPVDDVAHEGVELFPGVHLVLGAQRGLHRVARLLEPASGRRRRARTR